LTILLVEYSGLVNGS